MVRLPHEYLFARLVLLDVFIVCVVVVQVSRSFSSQFLLCFVYHYYYKFRGVKLVAGGRERRSGSLLDYRVRFFIESTLQQSAPSYCRRRR